VNSGVLRTPVMVVRQGSLDEFVRFWSGLYRYAHDDVYLRGVGGALTPERVEALFVWKNGNKPLSAAKRRTVQRYGASLDVLSRFGDEATASEIVPTLGGGVVWGVFFLHCLDPDRFPLFDQHVHRASRLLRGLEPEELLRLSKSAQLERYDGEFLPVVRRLDPQRERGRDIDRALWAFGKAMKDPGLSGLDWGGLVRASGVEG
jgi:hypothetical protein